MGMATPFVRNGPPPAFEISEVLRTLTEGVGRVTA